jgi:hypothetical protein
MPNSKKKPKLVICNNAHINEDGETLDCCHGCKHLLPHVPFKVENQTKKCNAIIELCGSTSERTYVGCVPCKNPRRK